MLSPGSRTSDYEFDLPEACIAQEPLARRDDSRLMVVDRATGTLEHGRFADVANLIGYSYRKLGDYKVSQIWYERALKADPNHVKTWQYYGLWQVEQGNRDQAQYHLSRIAAIAGATSEEYRSLSEALEKPPGTGLVY